MVEIDNLPAELKEECLFCCWRYEDRDGKRTKVPYNPKTGGRAQGLSRKFRSHAAATGDMDARHPFMRSQKRLMKFKVDCPAGTGNRPSGRGIDGDAGQHGALLLERRRSSSLVTAETIVVEAPAVAAESPIRSAAHIPITVRTRHRAVF